MPLILIQRQPGFLPSFLRPCFHVSYILEVIQYMSPTASSLSVMCQGLRWALYIHLHSSSLQLFMLLFFPLYIINVFHVTKTFP